MQRSNDKKPKKSGAKNRATTTYAATNNAKIWSAIYDLKKRIGHQDPSNNEEPVSRDMKKLKKKSKLCFVFFFDKENENHQR